MKIERCSDCKYYKYTKKEETFQIICGCGKVKKVIRTVALTPDWFVNNYNVNHAAPPEWCPYRDTLDHKDNEM